MDKRYERNIGALTQTEQELLQTKKAAVIGCGGLGCYIAEFLARIGLGHLTLIDGDVFAQSNLNRQLYALETNPGKNKALEAGERLLQIRSNLSLNVIDVFLTNKNAGEVLKGHDVIIDALDNVKARLLVEKTAHTLEIPLVHGAVEGWNAQVCTVFPGDFTLSMLYPADNEPDKPSVLSFTPAFCASLQASEAVKVLLKKENVLRKKLLIADLKEMTFDIVEF
ncbi:MAG: HesA/MoeB/ThiF family protein [Treponema sp.]|jgi:molybdopterin/thiamine biosynthesis adenylyltransferase|nr:HesA/MoeB/ThiF family protein [Treponema sp.]